MSVEPRENLYRCWTKCERNPETRWHFREIYVNRNKIYKLKASHSEKGFATLYFYSNFYSISALYHVPNWLKMYYGNNSNRTWMT